MLGRTVTSAVAALLLTGCGSVAETQKSAPRTAAAGTAQAENDGQDEARGCPRENWPGPWAACAEADWVRAVVRRAGYAAGSDTGSAIVASTDETGFFIHTTRGTTEKLERGPWVWLGTVAGTAVYGDGRPRTVDKNGLPTGDVWRTWSAQGFIFWVFAGPSAADVSLSFTALEPLIEASKEIPPPPR
jgi:hypothetical protein